MCRHVCGEMCVKDILLLERSTNHKVFDLHQPMSNKSMLLKQTLIIYGWFLDRVVC